MIRLVVIRHAKTGALVGAIDIKDSSVEFFEYAVAICEYSGVPPAECEYAAGRVIVSMFWHNGSLIADMDMNASCEEVCRDGKFYPLPDISSDEAADATYTALIGDLF